MIRRLFSIYGFPELTNERSKNAAKEFIKSGHKLILQNGILTHVDRKLDKKVFGPTIDTVIMAEEIYGMNTDPASILEIGCGSGHIASSIASLQDCVSNIVYCDVNPYAMTCTLRNLLGNLSVRRGKNCGSDNLLRGDR